MDLISRLVDRFTLTSKNEVVAIYPDDQAGFIDGNFDSWQVGTSFTLAAATDTYTADMWVCNAGTGGAATVSQVAATLGSEIASTARPRKYLLSYQQTTNASTSPTIGQKLEGVGQYSGQSITISGTFLAAVAGTDIVGVQATQNFGTGGAPSANVVTSKPVAWALATTQQVFSVRLDIPSISGKTLGTGGNDYLRIDFLLATGATYTVYASQLQIDVCAATASGDTTGAGGASQPFRYRGLSLELARLTRYIQVITPSAGGGFLSGGCTGTTSAYGFFFISKMRAAPAGSVLVGTFAFVVPGGTNMSGTNVASQTGPSSAYLAITGSTGGITGSPGYFGASTPAPVIVFDSRL